MFSVESVCVWVCVFVNTTSKRVNVGWWSLGVAWCIVQNYRPSSNLGVIPPPPQVRTPKMWFGYDVGKISAGCLVLITRLISLFETEEKTIQCWTAAAFLHGQNHYFVEFVEWRLFDYAKQLWEWTQPTMMGLFKVSENPQSWTVQLLRLNLVG